MTSPDNTDGSTSGATKQELNTGHNATNRAVVHAIWAEKNGLLSGDDDAQETLEQLEKTAKGGTD